ncbi:MAG TPA: hypothetical protein PLW44_02420 [Chitinophagales bacterium]|nr:hypothetical protein [Chitinophagales bacterium]
MANRKRKKKSTEELGTENELLKLKMMAEFGGDFMGSEDLPPEIENQFLKQVINFHKKHDSSEVISVYKFIGEPEYNHVNDLSDKEVDKELKRLTRIMSKNGVALSVLAETPKREVYRFITEELFKHEIENIRMRGWVSQFIYEEFHPNAEYDVRSTISTFIQSVFSKGSMFFDEHFSEEMKDNIGLSMEPDELREKITGFWEQHFNIRLTDYNYLQLQVDKENGTAQAVCTVNYQVQPEKGKRFKKANCQIEVNLTRSNMMDSWWEITQVVTDLF